MGAAVGVRGACLTHASGTVALDGVDLNVAVGEFVAVVGPSGCGKSSLLELIAGLRAPSNGDVVINGRPATDCVGAMAYLAQRDCLMPWRSVEENCGVGLEFSGVSRRSARDRARAELERCGLGDFAAARPDELSGGMRQRVALIRTLLVNPLGLLLDEPFGALDALTRGALHGWLRDVLAGRSATVVLVTHDIGEAVTLAERVVVLSPRPGSIVGEVAVNPGQQGAAEAKIRSLLGVEASR